MDTLTPSSVAAARTEYTERPPGTIATLGGGGGSVRQGVGVLSDLAVQPVQLGQPLLQVRQQPADLGVRASRRSEVIPGVPPGSVAGGGVAMGVHGFQGRRGDLPAITWSRGDLGYALGKRGHADRTQHRAVPGFSGTALGLCVTALRSYQLHQ